MKPIWIVDDDPSIRFVLEKALGREGWPIRSFTQARDVLKALADVDSSDPARQAPQVLVSDIRMPGGSGLELLEQVRAQQPGLPMIIMTAYSDLDSAVSAFQRGAFEYLPKPFDVPKAVELIRRAVEEASVRRWSIYRHLCKQKCWGRLLHAGCVSRHWQVEPEPGDGAHYRRVWCRQGTGWRGTAQALSRCRRAFVAINTAAIPKDLLESELFGHERGAFTGAQTQRRGRFEQAEGGTLFLDEIGDMPFELQTRLLRVLSDGHFYRVGGHQAVKAHVRVIAATHQDLELRVKDGVFREDLFHRLNVIRLRLPALRERREDIPMLTQHFLQQAHVSSGWAKADEHHCHGAASDFSFPGNVRQLENICHWLTVMAPAQQIALKDLRKVLKGGCTGGSGGKGCIGAGEAIAARTRGIRSCPVLSNDTPHRPKPGEALAKAQSYWCKAITMSGIS